MNCFASPWEPDYPPRPTVLLSEQGDTALFQLYKPHTHTKPFWNCAAAQRQSPKTAPKTQGDEPKIRNSLKSKISETHSCMMTLTLLDLGSLPMDRLEIQHARKNTNISQGLKSHLDWTWGSRAMTEKPTKKYELFWLTVGARSPTATNSITLRAGRYRYIPSLQATYTY